MQFVDENPLPSGTVLQVVVEPPGPFIVVEEKPFPSGTVIPVTDWPPTVPLYEVKPFPRGVEFIIVGPGRGEN